MRTKWKGDISLEEIKGEKKEKEEKILHSDIH